MVYIIYTVSLCYSKLEKNFISKIIKRKYVYSIYWKKKCMHPDAPSSNQSCSRVNFTTKKKNRERSEKSDHEILFFLNVCVATACRLFGSNGWLSRFCVFLPSMERLSMTTTSGPWPGPGWHLGGQTWALSVDRHRLHLPQVPSRAGFWHPFRAQGSCSDASYTFYKHRTL